MSQSHSKTISSFNLKQPQRFNPIIWGAVALLFLVALLVVLFSPSEQTLGQGIRAVYVHVGLTWTGTAVFVIAALVGAGILLTANSTLQQWLRPLGWVATGFYAAGVGMSMVASKVNWGSVFLREPRMAAALSTLGIAILFQIAISWFPWPRLGGLLSILLVAIMYWLTYQAPLVLHPSDPIGTSDATGIRNTFFILFGIFSLAAALITVYTHQRILRKV
ncbi:MAG: hypothetical protein GY943_06685 [Chloroflexi bacterium]|nr:hypothetical protein [Chloroflexota bacterium]